MTTTIPAVELLERLRTDGGFTFDPSTGRLVNVGDRIGWAIARPGTERIIGVTLDPAAFESELSVLLADYGEEIAGGALVGGWHSADRDVYMVELSDVYVVGEGQAVLLGALRGQESVFNLGTGRTVHVPDVLAEDTPLRVA
jgi:hypothetical protein